MKTFGMVLTIVMFLGITIPASSQSSFFFINYGLAPTNNPNTSAPVYDGAGNRLFGADYFAVLYGGATTDSLSLARNYFDFTSMTPVPFTATYQGGHGFFAGDPVIVFGAYGLTWLQVRAWDARLGSTYDEVVAQGIGGYGASPLFQAVGGYPFGGVPTPPRLLTGLPSFSLLPVVPEPSVGWLLLLGLPFLAARWLKSRRARK